MYKLYILLLTTLFTSASVSFASNTVDSIGVENNKGKKVIIYKVEAKETYYSIAKKYNVPYKEVMEFNESQLLQIGSTLKIPTSIPFTTPTTYTNPTPFDAGALSADFIEYTIKAKDNLNMLAGKYGTTIDEIKRVNQLNSINLRIGQVLKIPTTNGKVESITQPALVNTVKSDGNFEHTVATNETIYSIAKKYNLTTYQLKAANNLTENELTVGQKLNIKGASKTAINASVEEESESAETMKDPKLKQPASKFGLVRFDEKGVAVWIADKDLDPTKMFVLHRTATVGTIIRVTNPITNRSAFAKVVGKFTENETTKDVIIVMTKAVANAIGALDKRFFCNLNYGAVENEQR